MQEIFLLCMYTPKELLKTAVLYIHRSDQEPVKQEFATFTWKWKVHKQPFLRALLYKLSFFLSVRSMEQSFIFFCLRAGVYARFVWINLFTNLRSFLSKKLHLFSLLNIWLPWCRQMIFPHLWTTTDRFYLRVLRSVWQSNLRPGEVWAKCSSCFLNFLSRFHFCAW